MTEKKLFNRFKGKKIFITGNTGFKGSWLSIWLHELGADVYGYALAPTSNLDNFVVCKLEEKINQTYGDVTNFELLNSTIKNVNPDYIFHLAAQALVIDSYNDPISTYHTNVMGVVNLLQASRGLDNLKTIVVITSDKCYENKEQVWGYRENDELGGSDPYSSSKACAEIAVQSLRKSFFKDSPVSLLSTRAGNVIGGGDWSENRLIPDIFKTKRADNILEIRNPNATRPWEHVLEPLSGYMQLALVAENNKKYEGGWNFGPSTYKHYNVLEVVQEIEKSTTLKYELINQQNKLHEANLLKLDITKAANELNWIPQLSFEETIRFTVEGYLVQDNSDIYNHRVKQIKEYTTLAISNKTSWAL
jgi:CDP-glucose 4,6-dehydratase